MPTTKVNYYVHFAQDDPVLVYGPYELKPAKDFARIGSQHGGARAVRAGMRPDSRLVRVYAEGQRIWPSSPGQLAGLRAGERPKKLAGKPNPSWQPESVGVSPMGEDLVATVLPKDPRYKKITTSGGLYLGQIFDAGEKGWMAVPPDGKGWDSFSTEKAAAEFLSGLGVSCSRRRS